MSTTHYEININLDGEKWTPEQLESLGRGLREAERGEVFPVAALWDGIEVVGEEDREWMAADLSARPQKSDETNRVLGKATGQVEALTHYIDHSVAKELVALRRRVRKLERKLRKAAGREKRLMQWIEYKESQERLETWPMPPFAITNIPDDTRFTYGLPTGTPIPPASVEVTV